MLLFVQVIFLQFCLCVHKVQHKNLWSRIISVVICWENKPEQLYCTFVNVTSEGEKKKNLSFISNLLKNVT